MHSEEVNMYLQDLLGLEFNKALTIPHANARVAAGKQELETRLEDLPGYKEMLQANKWDMMLYEFCNQRLHAKLATYRNMR